MENLDWLQSFPALLKLEPNARDILIKSASMVEAPVGTIGYREGGACGAYVMRLAGQSRVYKMSTSGREILLYRVAAGETCVITTTCLLGHSNYPASTIVEEPIRDVIIPAPAFNQLMADELGTAREVVSRQLKRYEQKGWVALGRGHVEISNRAALEKLATS